MKNPLRTLPAILLALFAAGAVHAGPTTLDALLNGGTITAGDKLFDHWSVVSYSNSDGRSFNAANIEVEALTDGGQDPGPGLRFTALNDELFVRGDDIFAFVDLMFGFSVTSLDPRMRIKDASLLNPVGQTVHTPDGSVDVGVYIRENVDTAGILTNPLSNGNLGTMLMQFDTLDVGAGEVNTRQLSDEVNFAPQSEIWVTKNIYVWARDLGDAAGISGFDQRFSQIPEPASYALVAIALAGMLAPTALRRGGKG